MSEPKKDGTDMMMALLSGLSGRHASDVWKDIQAEAEIESIKADIHTLKVQVEQLTKENKPNA